MLEPTERQLDFLRKLADELHLVEVPPARSRREASKAIEKLVQEKRKGQKRARRSEGTYADGVLRTNEEWRAIRRRLGNEP